MQMTLRLQQNNSKEKTKTVKYLNVHVHNKLTWKIHINYLTKNF